MSTTEADNQCPRCRGQGFTVGYGCPGFVRMEIACHVCEGTGSIESQRAQALAEGQAFHNERVARQETLREAAQRLGVTPEALSAFENRGMPLVFS